MTKASFTRRGPRPTLHGMARLQLIDTEGRLHFALHAGDHGASLSVEAGEWVALPRGLARSALPVGRPALDVLRLHPQAA